MSSIPPSSELGKMQAQAQAPLSSNMAVAIHVPFNISAPPNTDIWKLPPKHDVYDAPKYLLAKEPLTSFDTVSVTFTGHYIHQYDQAGLVLTMTNPHEPKARKWIKTGVEFYEGQPRLSTVCTDNWSDWSVAPAPCWEDIKDGKKGVTISVEKEIGDDGSPYLWVNYVDEAHKKTQLRQIGWVFGDHNGEGWDLEIAAMAARPNTDAKDEFHAKFSKASVSRRN